MKTTTQFSAYKNEFDLLVMGVSGARNMLTKRRQG